jgi:hypothetical protein
MKRTHQPTLAAANRFWAQTACCLGLALSGVAQANDLPFQNARTAVVEEDNEATWSVESWVQRIGRVRGLSIEPEYTFTPYTSVQMEFTRLLDKGPERAGTGHEAEIEFKHLFKDIGVVDGAFGWGWGWGLSLAFSGERTAEEDGTQRVTTLKLPVSIALGRTGALLHLNAGLVKPSAARRVSTASAAIEFEVVRHARGFAEFAKEGDKRYAQIGVRHWLKHEKLALDFSLQQSRQGGERQSGFILGMGFYDL